MMAESALLHRVWRVAISLDTEPPVIGFRRRRIEPVSDLSRPFAHESFTDAVFAWLQPVGQCGLKNLRQKRGVVHFRRRAGWSTSAKVLVFDLLRRPYDV